MWMTSWTGSVRGGFWDFEESQSWVLRSEEEGWLSIARSGLVLGAHVMGVIKSFVPELRSRKCFSCFGIPMFYVYVLWTFYVRFTHIRIWLWYNMSLKSINQLSTMTFSEYLRWWVYPDSCYTVVIFKFWLIVS